MAQVRASSSATQSSSPPGGNAASGFDAALRSALTEPVAAPPEQGAEDSSVVRRGPLSSRAMYRQSIGAAMREQRQASAPEAPGAEPTPASSGDVRPPQEIAAELEAATAEGRTVRISQAEYRALVDHNAQTLLPEFRGGWSQELGLFTEGADHGARHRTVDYNGVIASGRSLPGFEDLHGATEVPAHLQGPDGGPLTVFRPSPNFWNTGGGRYLPPEVSNSPDHHLAAAPGAERGPELRA